MKRIAKFEKISYEQFRKSVINIFDNLYSDEQIAEFYKNIALPTRATSGSAGYDFVSPIPIMAKKHIDYVIPTGIRCRMDDGWVLNIYPRSGLGFKRGMRLMNTVGIIDSDYYRSDNEGHIMLKITHETGDYILQIQSGNKIAQGVFTEYGITEDDETTSVRNGGFGSTDNQQV